MTSALEVSISMKNYALGYRTRARIIGLVLVHVLFIKRFIKSNGLMMAINIILGLVLTRLVFSTIE
jgi:hypothetical protein